MTLFYNDPNEKFPTPSTSFSPEDIEHKKILNNWFAFTDTLEPEFSKLTFFPKNILPYDQETYLQAFIKEFREHKKLGSLTPEILNSIAINVGNLFRFSSLIDKGIHKIYAQNILDYPEQIAIFDKNSLRDTYLQQSLIDQIFAFCEQESFPKEVMYFSNFLFLSTSNQAYNSSCKNKFLNQQPEDKKISLQRSSEEENEIHHPEGAINKYFEKNKWSWNILVLLINLFWIALTIYLLKENMSK